MSENNHLQIVTSGLHRTAGPYTGTWSSGAGRQVRAGARFCGTMRLTSLQWTCSLFQLLASTRSMPSSSSGWRAGTFVCINVTANPTAEWIARQITEAFPWNEAPRYLIRDRDRVYGATVTRRLRAMGIRDKPIAPGSPWRNGVAERSLGSIRRECTDHVAARRGALTSGPTIQSYARYYNVSRTHRSLNIEFCPLR